MADDIVDQLNSSYAFLRDPLHLEARNEIDRLRAALRGVLNADGVTDEIAKLARAALAGEKKND